MNIFRCITWHQEWGDGHECKRTEYQVRNDFELWLTGPRGPLRAGTLSHEKAHIEYNFPGGFNKEDYVVTDDGLNYSNTYIASGMEWFYQVRLSRLSFGNEFDDFAK